MLLLLAQLLTGVGSLEAAQPTAQQKIVRALYYLGRGTSVGILAGCTFSECKRLRVAKKFSDLYCEILPDVEPEVQEWCQQVLAPCPPDDIRFKYRPMFVPESYGKTIILPHPFHKELPGNAFLLRHERGHIHYDDSSLVNHLITPIGSACVVQAASSTLRYLRKPQIPTTIGRASVSLACGILAGIIKSKATAIPELAWERHKEYRADSFALKHTTPLNELVEAAAFFNWAGNENIINFFKDDVDNKLITYVQSLPSWKQDMLYSSIQFAIDPTHPNPQGRAQRIIHEITERTKN